MDHAYKRTDFCAMVDCVNTGEPVIRPADRCGPVP